MSNEVSENIAAAVYSSSSDIIKIDIHACTVQSEQAIKQRAA